MLLLVFFNKRYSHQLEMISVMKLRWGVALFGLQDVNVLRLCQFVEVQLEIVMILLWFSEFILGYSFWA